MHALAWSPRCHIHPRSKGPLGFALAVVLAVEEPSSDGKGSETEDEYDEHDNPAPVRRHPRGAQLVGERVDLAGYILPRPRCGIG